ncbi:SLC13 family permease [Lysobacter sp. LF1]|uniref:SLC13 family permease n=1 Tax=Lysobacter stagni TaxID=3045172 RepID=A0ABT6XHK9_9GAMM|nr:SLC13 family permease [Lysobacter sp. LF1]MDI9239554.1 SLC13 family permease [Lysobacter sp. LF1]
MVLLLLGGAIVMFAIGRPRSDVVGLLMVAALPLTGVIDIGEAIAGFADPSIVLIALLFVLGEGLSRTGVAQRLSELIVRFAGPAETRLMVALMVAVATIGSVMSSTGVVAIFIPIVLRICQRVGIAPGRLMMPLSVAALVSGMMTLVATAPNLVVQSELLREGHPGFEFFAFAPFGVPVLVVAIAYMLFARRWLGRDAQAVDARPGIEDWIGEYALAGRACRVRVRPASPLIGRVAADCEGSELAGVHVLAIEQSGLLGRTSLASPIGVPVEAGATLLLDVHDRDVDAGVLFNRQRLESLPLQGNYFSAYANDIGMAEALVTANSPLVGRTARETRLRDRHELVVIGLRHGRSASRDPDEERMEVGDTLLLVGPWPALRSVGVDSEGLVLLNLPGEADDVAPAASRAPFALAILVLTVAMMVTGVVANAHAALIGCLLMGVAGCVDLRGAYRAIHWPSLVLIVGMLPFSLALQRTGGVDLAADLLLDVAGGAGPRAVLTAVFVVTAVLGMFISNTAVAVLMAPVALAIADHLDASAAPFAMTVALAASTAFMTPVSSPVNALVVGPGGYGFADFVRVGTPLALLVLVVTVALVPVLLPF